LRDVVASILVKCPLILRSQTILSLTVLRVLVKIKVLLEEHRLIGVANWHGHLVASEYVPAVSIEVTSALPVAQISAAVLASPVEIHIGGIDECLEHEDVTCSEVLAHLGRGLCNISDIDGVPHVS